MVEGLLEDEQLTDAELEKHLILPMHLISLVYQSFEQQNDRCEEIFLVHLLKMSSPQYLVHLLS